MSCCLARRASGVALLLVGLAVSFAGAADGDRGDPDPTGCGVRSLYTLLRLEGRTADLVRIAGCLPPAPPAGHSLRELRDAARACGLDLVGVRLRSGDEAPDRPALVYLDDGSHGHFVVVRPVGHTGKMLQVLDPNRPPVVVDAIELYQAPRWTGLALVPIRTNWSARIASGLALATALLLAFPLAISRLRRRPPPQHTRGAGGSGGIIGVMGHAGRDPSRVRRSTVDRDASWASGSGRPAFRAGGPAADRWSWPPLVGMGRC